jgi:hypothetical protein
VTAAGRASVLAGVLGAAMTVQAATGLAFPTIYRDVEWVLATWWGNDLVTLALAVPLLGASVLGARRGALRGHLTWCGIAAYAVYNYLFYLLGASLNLHFPLYVGLVLLGVASLVTAIVTLPPLELVGGTRPARVLGGYLVFVATGLTVVWVGTWAAYVFAGRPTPVAPEAFRLIAALDLVLMVPALSVGGILLWRRQAAGPAIATIAAIQAALYLLVLTVNSVVMISRGLAEAPGELPIWGSLLVPTAAATMLVLRSARTTR